MTDQQANAARFGGSFIKRIFSPDHVIGQQLLALRMRLQMLAWQPVSDDDRALRSVIATLAPAYTMMSLDRLRTLAAHAETVHREGVVGAVVECGSWRGGSLALIDWVMRRRRDARSLWAFDSFEGLPPPGARDSASARHGFFPGWCAATEDDVRRAFAAAGNQTDRLRVVRGWLADTIPMIDTGPIALLSLDVDWHDSVRTALEGLFDRVSPGGIINVDDYGRWSGCDEAVHEFMRSRRLPIAMLQRTGRHGAWLQKPR
jgi:O-methyltransferase